MRGLRPGSPDSPFAFPWLRGGAGAREVGGGGEVDEPPTYEVSTGTDSELGTGTGTGTGNGTGVGMVTGTARSERPLQFIKS